MNPAIKNKRKDKWFFEWQGYSDSDSVSDMKTLSSSVNEVSS